MNFVRITPDWLHLPHGIGSFFTERAGGVSRAPYDDGCGNGGLNLGMHVGDDPVDVQKNRLLLRADLPAEPVWLTQVHGNAVIDADALNDADQRSAAEADASITSTKGRVCIIQTADCLPVLFCSSDGKVVGAAHAGWRGLASGVLENTIEQMRRKGAGEITAWLGPAIGPQKFEVGRDVLDAFTAIDPENATAFQGVQGQAEKHLADIYLLAKIALKRGGVSGIAGGNFCTVTEERRFYSYRRDGVTGRMASLIWIK